MPGRILRATRSSVANQSYNHITISAESSTATSLTDLSTSMNSIASLSELSQQLPAKRSWADIASAATDSEKIRQGDNKEQGSLVTAPGSPTALSKGAARPIPSSPSRNTRAARASARQAARQEQHSASSTASGSSPPRSSGKRAKLSHDASSSTAANSANSTSSTDKEALASVEEALAADADDAAADENKERLPVVDDVEMAEDTAVAATATTTKNSTKDVSDSPLKSTTAAASPTTGDADATDSSSSTKEATKSSSATSVADVPAAETASASAAVVPAPPAAPPSPPPPLKSLTMSHLRKKYLQELEYMRAEFRKLEKQLLGARASAATESDASRERREKLHSFILHLEETIVQIREGVEMEKRRQESPSASSSSSSKKASAAASASVLDDSEAKREFADQAALTKLTREKEEEETVQKLEEHILANLLPVKVRLTKQLAAQQGATRNPAGMPTSARGPRPSAAAIGKGTFAAAAEERRKREEAARLAAEQAQMDGGGDGGAVLSPPPTTSLLGKPLRGGGSSLTARLHGSTLGSKTRTAGHGVGQTEEQQRQEQAQQSSQMRKVASTNTDSSVEDDFPKRQILYAGMAPGSEQVSSSVSAAQGAHKMVVTDPTLRAAHRAGLAADAIEEGAGALASLASAKGPPPPSSPPRPPRFGAQGDRSKRPLPASAAAKPGLVVISGSDSSSETILTREAAADSVAATRTASSLPAGPASDAVIKVQNRQVATAAQLAARAKARAAAGLPPLDTPLTSAAAAELLRTGKKSTADRGPRRRLSDKALADEEKERLIRRRDRRRRRRRKAKRLERERIRHATYAAQTRHVQAEISAAAAAAAAAVAQTKPEPPKRGVKGKSVGAGSSVASKKTGPRSVEYICGLCNEAYTSTSDVNPWWALRQQDCPKCGKKQVPRIDISAPANAIQYHPALLAHAEDSSSSGQSGSASVALRGKGPVSAPYASTGAGHLVVPPKFPDLGDLYASEDETSEDDEAVSLGGESSDDSGDDDGVLGFNGSLTPAERAEAEDFGHDYAGPKLEDGEASRLLILMGHASTCPGRHRKGKLREVCHSTKFMMMHVRDCPGTTSTFDVCPFPWCRKVKHLLYHLVSCQTPDECSICTPNELPQSFKALKGLNAHRHKKQREKMRAAAAAAASARAATAKAKVPAAYPHLKKGPGSSRLPVVKLPPTKFIPPPPKSGSVRHPGSVPNSSLARPGAKTTAPRYSASTAPTLAKTPAGRARHPGASHGASSLTKAMGATAKGAPFSAKPASAPANASATVTARHPGAAIGIGGPVTLRGSTPNPLLPFDDKSPTALKSASVGASSRPTPNPLAPAETATVASQSVPPVGAVESSQNRAPSEVKKEDAIPDAVSPPSREATPPDNGCAGEAAKATEAVRVVED